MLQTYATENVAERVKLPQRKRKIPRWLSESELIRFVSTPVTKRHSRGEKERFRDEVAWKTLAWLGLRRSEVFNLRLRDIHLQEGQITIRDSKGDRDRTLPLPNELKSLFIKLIGHRQGEEYVFPGERANGQWGRTSFVGAFYNHLRNCGLDNKNITPHTLRHTFATHLSLKGVRIEVIKELLGHADIKTTMIYLHNSYADLQRGLSLYILSTLKG